MKVFLIVALLLCIDCNALAQVSSKSFTRRVSREVQIIDSDYVFSIPRKLRNEENDTGLYGLLNKRVLSGYICAYAYSDSFFRRKLCLLQLDSMNKTRLDTVYNIDPISANPADQFSLISKDRDNSRKITLKYQVLEDWHFDKTTGRTTIDIIGIAPMIDDYGDDGIYKRTFSLYWVKYNDAKTLLDFYKQSHPNTNFALSVWNDFFTDKE